jgi:hypothetical protein
MGLPGLGDRGEREARSRLVVSLALQSEQLRRRGGKEYLCGWGHHWLLAVLLGLSSWYLLPCVEPGSDEGVRRRDLENPHVQGLQLR